MEVAGQWRREWAGTAEYGKVTEGGVTRRIARAMEVLNASGPGARVRVMRAAYHSTAGPGIPAASYMLHSSRRVISSGFNLLESPSLPYNNKPLEISSTPLEPFRDLSAETDNYKVTEPDDTEISEPSKWRVASSGSSIRMPSEESSSTDNASIIDLDNRSSHRNVFRKYSHDSENSDIQPSKRNSARASPLLDAPTTLSTLKYKSLLNGSNDWNNRRKSYSFEDTCPVNETIIHSNDTLAMESSTDSGICKSSEKVYDQDDNMHLSYSEAKEKKYEGNDETFKDWLHKHRPNTLQFYKGTQLKPCKEHETDKTLEQAENNIILQSSGKVCITVPMTIEKRDEHTSEEADRRVKKVEFCKTELHFAAESGKVNIIATDEKPPPSNDFRKRRSAFIPITDTFERPVTLFSEKRDIAESIHFNDSSIYSNSENYDFDENENTAATKSILKNKIPKPKPYLLGENMVFGHSDEINDTDRMNDDAMASLGVSLINKQLQTEKKYSNDIISTFSNAVDTSYTSNYVRTTKKGPSRNEGSNIENKVLDDESNNAATLKNKTFVAKNSGSIRNKLDVQPISPVQKPKTRKLRDSDLMYFGIDNNRKNSFKDKIKYVESVLTSNSSLNNDVLKSVKLIKQVSNSAANSEAESEDAPEYQNIPVISNIIPVPTPRPRAKYDKTRESEKGGNLQPIMEQSNQNMAMNTIQEVRRSRSKKHEDVVVPALRSRSEPSKNRTNSVTEKSRRDQHVHVNNIKRDTPSPRLKKHQGLEKRTTMQSQNKVTHKNSVSEAEAPLYINLNIVDEKTKKSTRHQKSQQKRDKQIETSVYLRGSEDNTEGSKNYKTLEKPDANKLSKSDTAHDTSEKRSNKKTNNIHRTKKLVTPENSFCIQSKTEEDVSNNRLTKTNPTKVRSVDNENSTSSKVKKKRSLSSQRHLSNAEELNENVDELKRRTTSIKEDTEKRGPKYPNSYPSKEQTNTKKDTVHHNEIIHNHDLKVVNNTADRKGSTEPVPKKLSHKTPRRSEYVINYDDKNGTVSSVCKVKPDHISSKRKTITKESSKDTKIKNKMIDKTPLLQLPDRQWNQNGLRHENKKWKTKIHAQRSCQLL